jgi:UDP:flavonoid glycosyltransferase YjiC (YdhE family)
MLPAMDRACREWRPDLVLREPCEYASAVVAGRLGIPTAQVAISLAEGEEGSIAAAAPALEAHRDGLVEELRASPYLTRFPASLDPSPFAHTVRFRETRDGIVRPLPDWWEGSEAPLVYVSFGTVLGYMTMAATVYRTVLEALAPLPVRALLTVGHRFDPSGLDPLPGNVHVEAWVEQADVFGHAELVVCHGGSGTAFGALAAALPVLVVPVFADQFENGRRIAEAGAGLVVDAAEPKVRGSRRVIARDDALRITRAIATMLAKTSYRDHARRIAGEIASAPTVDAVLDTLLPDGMKG